MKHKTEDYKLSASSKIRWIKCRNKKCN